MPSIANRKRNANQNHSEVSPHAHENGHRHKNRTLVRTWRSPVRRSWKAVWRFPPPKSTPGSLRYSSPTSGYTPQRIQSRISKRGLHSGARCSAGHSQRGAEAARTSIRGWTENVAHTQSNTSRCLEKGEILPHLRCG